MESCDTNILLYYLNAKAPEHQQAHVYLETKFREKTFILSEYVLAELYVLLRSPAVVEKPISASQAAEVIQRFRSNPYWLVIEHINGVMDRVWDYAKEPDFSRTELYDARLALTLISAGVKTFATRNTKHFKRFGFDKILNPID